MAGKPWRLDTHPQQAANAPASLDSGVIVIKDHHLGCLKIARDCMQLVLELGLLNSTPCDFVVSKSLPSIDSALLSRQHLKEDSEITKFQLERYSFSFMCRIQSNNS